MIKTGGTTWIPPVHLRHCRGSVTRRRRRAAGPSSCLHAHVQGRPKTSQGSCSASLHSHIRTFVLCGAPPSGSPSTQCIFRSQDVSPPHSHKDHGSDDGTP